MTLVHKYNVYKYIYILSQAFVTDWLKKNIKLYINKVIPITKGQKK